MCLIFPEVSRKVSKIVFLQSVAFVFVIVAQFFQPMLITSISLSLNLAILVSFLIFSWNGSHFLSFRIVIFRGIFVIFLTGGFQILVKFLFRVESDSHIWNFVKAKFGFGVDELPFESAIYICHGAFQFLDWGFVERTKKTGVLPMYALSILVVGFSQIFLFLKKRSKLEKLN